MSFVLPRGQVLPVHEIDMRLLDTPHPYEAAYADRIAENWKLDHAANPHLFNGIIVMPSAFRLSGTRLTGECNAVNYATLLYWRKNKGPNGLEHGFAFPALVSRDNALVAIRMGKHTANPGRIYFPAGSFEPGDFVGGQVDVHGNMCREVVEETGLDISSAPFDPHYHIFSQNYATVLFRRYWLDEDAETLARRIEGFVAAEAEPEIEGPVVIRKGDNPENMSPHMAAIVRWHFGRE
ncbi:MAG: NUDIX hydrolase [Rhizobiaceae bacterium]|nr:NUDIX hydrolase [Rhizobiaceae bacterium]